MHRYHLHLVSDATGETLESVAKACLVQFEGVDVIKHFWPMIRSERQLDKVVADIAMKPGLVLYTLVNQTMRDRLHGRCVGLGLPAISVLDPVLQALAAYLGATAKGLPGKQHALDAAYFRRIDAVHYTLAHDDGQNSDGWPEAEIIILGVSRTSKTPTSIYLANRGYKTANYPLVPNVPPPEALNRLSGPLIVGFVASADRLIQVRRNRLLSLKENTETDYIDTDKVNAELVSARRLFADRGWPIIDVTRRSIEEIAAAVINLAIQRAEETGEAAPPDETRG